RARAASGLHLSARGPDRGLVPTVRAAPRRAPHGPRSASDQRLSVSEVRSATNMGLRSSHTEVLPDLHVTSKRTRGKNSGSPSPHPRAAGRGPEEGRRGSSRARRHQGPSEGQRRSPRRRDQEGPRGGRDQRDRRSPPRLGAARGAPGRRQGEGPADHGGDRHLPVPQDPRPRLPPGGEARRPLLRVTGPRRAGAGTAPAPVTVLAGPTAVGKGTVSAKIREQYPQIWLSVSATTRPPRPGEVDGVHYRFVSEDEFTRLVDSDQMLEWAVVHGRNKYGTPRGPVEQKVAEGRPVLLEIDLAGAAPVRETLAE